MKGKKEEGYEFEMPEFDEKKFIEKEKRKAKIYFIAFAFGIVMGIICRFAWVNISPGLRWILTFLLAVCSLGFLAKIFQIFDIDISKFGKKEWLGSISFYLFTWLAIFILAINPPFYDASPPKIDAVSLPAIQQAGGSVLIAAKITDNVAVRSASVNITDGSSWSIYDMQKDGDVYTYSYASNKTGDFNYTIIATDKNGRESTFEGNFSFVDDAILVDAPSKNVDASDEIEIMVIKGISSENFRVYYKIGGKEINATYSREKTIGNKVYEVYETSPSYEGWNESSSVKVEVFAEVIHYFMNVEKEYSNNISGGTYTFNTTADSSIGSAPSPVIKDLPQPRSLRQTPGFGAFAFVVAVAVALLIFRRRK